MLAGLAYGFTHAVSFEETLIHGVAAGTANTLLVGAGNFTFGDFETVRSQVTCHYFS
jgi:fructose-1-phosphate kinase PfkB-like protein